MPTLPTRIASASSEYSGKGILPRLVISSPEANRKSQELGRAIDINRFNNDFLRTAPVVQRQVFIRAIQLLLIYICLSIKSVQDDGHARHIFCINECENLLGRQRHT